MTRIGTPLSPSATRVLLCGSGELGKEVAIELQRLGCEVIAVDRDGSTLYQSIAAIFIAQLYGIDLSIGQQIMLVLTLMVTSKGIAGVPGVSFVVLLATLGSVGIPLEGLAFIAGVDRIMDMARTALNVIGNALAVLVISKWEGMYDAAKGQRYWDSLPHLRQAVGEAKGKQATLE